MRCETLLCLLKNTSVNYQILSQRPRAEVCVEARLHPLDQSRISLLSASSFTFSLVLSNHTAANRKFTEKLPKPARNVSLYIYIINIKLNYIREGNKSEGAAISCQRGTE